MSTIIREIKEALEPDAPIASFESAGLLVQHLSQAKRVTKPWGFEIWLADGSQGTYAFKLIYLKKGTRTSLQYHKKKAEHNFVLAGTVILHYQSSKTGDVVQQRFSAGHVIAIDPPTVHRIEAVTDVMLIESSTAEVDDVIRLADDYTRGDGRIAEEHRAGQV